MNLALYLTPTPHLVCLDSRLPVREALERLEQTTFTAVPVIDADRCYLGTLTEGDLLRFLRSGADLDDTRLLDVPIRSENRAVSVVATIDAVVELAMDQNFVPVVDSRGVLMGIVTRKTILRVATRERGAP